MEILQNTTIDQPWREESWVTINVYCVLTNFLDKIRSNRFWDSSIRIISFYKCVIFFVVISRYSLLLPQTW